jgi:SAM-dependent methyltransferase
MRDNVKTFAEMASRAFAVPEPVLEIGSRPAQGQEGYAELRPFFSDKRYIGGDFLPGPAVDVLLDTHLLGVRDGQVGSVVMMDTLEHVQDPLLALREAHRVLQPDGLVLIGSVMNFPIHNHPWDYWRFTPAAFDLLLRPFPLRAVWYQGDPFAPHTVLAAARKAAAADAVVAFETAVASLEANWPEHADGGPLIRFEPLLDAFVRDSDQLGQEERTLPDLVSGLTVEQTFVCPADNLARIDTKYRTYGHMNFCHLNFQLRDETSGRVVAERRYGAQHVVDRVWTAFAFSPIADSAGRPYRLIISSWDGREGAAVAPVLSDEPGSNAEKLYVGGEYQPGVLCVRALCLAPDYSPPDYRSLSGLAAPAAIQDAAIRSVDAALLRRISMTQSAQLWQVASRVDDRIDSFERHVEGRLESAEADLRDILSFVRGLRSSFVYKAARRAGGLFRRRGGER